MVSANSVISGTTLAACGVGILFTVVLPVVLLIVLAAKRKITGLPLLAGFLSFFVSQIVLRIPLMQLASGMAWYRALAANMVVYLLVVGGFSAGLFEETARLVGAKLLKKHRGYKDMIGFGLGHGLCEVVVLVGMNYINSLLLAVAFAQPSGQLLAALTPGVDAATLELLRTSVAGVTPYLVVLAIVERVGAVAFHMFNTCLVFQAVRTKKYGLYALAILAHTLLNFLVVLVAGVSPLVSELCMLAVAAACVWYLRRAKPAFQQPQQPLQQTP